MGLAGTMLTYGNIRVNAPYEIIRLLDFELTQKINEHGKVYITALIPDEDHAKYDGLAYDEDVLEVYETDKERGTVSIFKGIVTNIRIAFKNGVYHMYIEAASFTYLMDQQRKNRSFQNSNLTYYQLFRELIDAYPHGDFIDLTDSDQKLGGFTIQYGESDWEFLKRMASHQQTGLIAEITSVFPRLWLGTSKEQVKGELRSINFSLQKTKSGPEYTYAEVEDTKRFELGDVVVFQRKHWVINQIHAEMKQGIMTYGYVLVPEAGIPREVIHNPLIKGTSIEGKVIELDGENESVKLHLSVDYVQSKVEGCWFSYPTMYTSDGIGWHCMPELGDHVHLYFPSNKEKEARVVQSLRKRDYKEDEISKPSRKLFHTKTQKVARFDDKEVALSTQKEKILVRLNPASGIHVYSHHDLTFHADTDLVLHGKKVQMTATREITLTCKTSYIRTDGTLHIKASKLMKNQVPDAELKAYKSLVQELKGKGYPQWVQDLLLQYKTDYYKAVAAGDKKGAKEAAAKAKQLRQQVAEIDRMPAWARAQMHEYTSQWWEAHGANDKAKQKQMHLLANQLRDNVLINELIRGHSANSYLDANRLEELSGQYADAAHKLTVADQKALAKEAAALRSKYGVNSLLARDNLNKLAKKYPDSFSYKLPTTGDWDKELNAALHDFAKKYGLDNKGYGRDVLAVYLHQVANGILPWPKASKAATPTVPTTTTTKTEPGKKPPTTPEKPTKEEPKPLDPKDYKDGLVAVKKIESYISSKGIKGNQARALYRINDYTNNSIVQKKLSSNRKAPLVFFFEGDGSYSYAQDDHQEGRYGATAIVVIDGEIKYTSNNASTLPDYENEAATVNEGVYEFKSGRHRGTYPALRIRNGGGVPSIMQNKKHTATGINIHKGFNKDSSQPKHESSTGCITIHKYEFTQFLIAVGVVKHSLEDKYINEEIYGLAIIDRKDRTKKSITKKR
ncbi:contractile injection system protein, VgrG/Pvc8 family [Paenibacillus sp. FSL M7-0134]|uniref:contractile injection system protein, VgrG/Pvc8 family n=1 Tax=Paenibacillus sp. FSL M7-0134 TaxID=2954754 RepID=UPI0030F8CD19